MSRNTLAFGASILAISVASFSIAQAQQSLPTIDVGAARRAPSTKQTGLRGGGRATGATTASAQPSTIVAAPAATTFVDRYATPTPAPFSRTLPSNLPAVVEGRTRQQVDNTVNYVTSAQAFKYLPSVTIRERFPGDRPILSGRTVGTAGTAQTLVYSDNILLSNLLGNGFAWGQRTDLVSPEEIERVDVMYGPFSALYPGNSIGGVFAITTRMPESFEVHARGVGTAQTFSQNGYSDTPLTGNLNIMVGDKINDFRYFLTWNHLDASGQPLQFSGGTLAPATANAFNPFGNTTGPAFFGGEYGFQQNGFPRILTGATGIQRNVQDLGKVKLAYDVAPLTRLTYQGAFWNNDLNTSVESYIRDRNGNPIYNTQTGSLEYYQPGSTNPARGLSVTRFGAMNPSVGESQHLMQSLQFKRDTGGLLDFDLSVSSYNYLRDFNNSARAYGMLPNNNLMNGGAVGSNPATTPNIGASGFPYLFNPTGLNTELTGTYWRTGDARFIYRPDVDLMGRHEFSFGGHTDVYSLNQVQTQTAYYPSNAYFGVSQYNRGKTNLQGIYLQDAWKVNEQVKFILGARGDFWEAYNGQNVSGGLNVQNNRAWGATNANNGLFPVTNIGGMTPAVNYLYPSTSKSGFQPKAAVEWRPHDRYEARVSMGRAYRFPTVAELFSDVSIPGTITRANPSLQPEISTSWDFTQSFRFVDAFNGAVGLVNPRISVYLDDRWNAIERSQTTIGGVNISTNGNIGHARFRGIETVLELRDILVKGLGFSGSLTLQKSQVVSGGGLCNTTYVQTPTYIGNAAGCTTPFTPSPFVFPGIVPTAPTFYGFMLNGRTFPSIPDIRLRSVITYQPSDKLDMALGTRFNTATFTTVSNQDWNHDVYGSSYSAAILFDAKVNYRFAKDWVASVGVDNIGNYKWYNGPHPYNMRTFYAGVKYDFVADKGRGGLFSPAVDGGSQEETLAFR
jgi:iron complex outermembrane receptor protein